MKIEKVNDNQIKCTLNRFDLASRQIKISELAYGSDKAKSLFRDMMQQASLEFGFETEDIPLMIEAIPVSADCIVLLITKVNDPDELDTRFSKFAPDDSEYESSLLQIGDEAKRNNPDFIIKDSANDDSDDSDFIPLEQLLRKRMEQLDTDKKPEASKKTADTNSISKAQPLTTCFSFESIDMLITAASALKGTSIGSNTLYKSPINNRYYLYLSQGSLHPERYANLCNLLSEYGRIEHSTVLSKNYYDEHFKKILVNRALQKLSTIL